jgi:hypothetical protein
MLFLLLWLFLVARSRSVFWSGSLVTSGKANIEQKYKKYKRFKPEYQHFDGWKFLIKKY